ncbi:MAG: tetratricopeptide repeat protein [Lentisphaeraceae bacterium]|nr:tetratricopeptide repeat protein [Lentisphaeraceae bacterium]
MFRIIKNLSLLLMLINSSFSQNAINQSASNDLLKQGNQLLEKRDFEKAKLTYKLYQKYVEKNTVKWLDAQLLLIRCNIETNNFIEADRLLLEASKKAAASNPNNKNINNKIDLLKAEIFEIRNEFYKAEELYRQLISTNNSAEVQIRLANNLIDRVLTGYSKSTQKDYDELRNIVGSYEKNDSRNPLELIRIKQKVSSYQMINKQTLANLEKLNSYWIRKDEFILFKIYLNNALRKYNDAYKVWSENHDIISLKTHPLSVPTLVNLSRHFLETKLENSVEINKTLQVLIRDEKEKSLVNEIIIEQLIEQKKTQEALSLYQDFIKNTPTAHNKNAIIVSLSEAFLDIHDYKTCLSLMNSIPDDSVLSAENKSRKVYIEASLLQADGKDLDAAVLFLRVGQTASNPQIALKSLFLAGKSFYGANQCNRAVIAFKILLEKRRNSFTDEAMYYLSRSHAQCKNYKEALAVIDRIVIVGKNPDLKKNALFEKGDYYLKSGDVNKAIESYNDYTVVYTDDSRNAAIWMKIYNIHRNLKDLDSSEKILSQIIEKSSKSSPEIYSSALHQKALIHQLKGENRKSISLWQAFLEFNQKVPNKLSDDVKIMLAAAYQNSEVLNLDAAKSIYLEIIENSKMDSARNIAIYNLINMTESNSQALPEILSKVLTLKSPLGEDAAHQCLEAAFKKLADSPKKFKSQVNSFISKIKNPELQAYWKSRMHFRNKKYSEALKSLNLISTKKYLNRKSLLQKKTYLALNKPKEALAPCLEIIYSFSADLSQNKYSNWEDLENAALTAARILKSMGQTQQILKIKERIVLSKIPNADSIALSIDKILGDKG